MKTNFLKLIICLVLSFGLILGLCACQNGDNSDTGSDQTNTDSATDTSTESSTDTSSDVIIEHTVTFLIDGVKYTTQAVIDGEAILVPAPIKPGYTLSPWLCNGVEYDVTLPVTSDLTLNATWSPSVVTITFDANGGSGTMESQKTVVKGSVDLNACTFTKDGYNFRGWATSANGSVFYNDEATFYASTATECTLYAIWSAKTNVLRLDTCNPIYPDVAEFEIRTDEEFSLTTLPYREYHNFLGWSTTKGGAVDFELNSIYTMGAEPSYTLYAVWEAQQVENQAIDVIKNNLSGYVIIYQKGNAADFELASALASLIKEKYNITISCYDNTIMKQDKEIIIGCAREQGCIVSYKTGAANDFYIGACSNDLVIYAPNEFMYDYMLEIASVEIFNGNDVSFTADGAFKYSSSKYKDLTYTDYYVQKNGAFDYNKLLDIFKAKTYVAQDGTSLPYRIYVPSNYDPSKPMPVVTILHGAGERGTDNSSQLKNMVAKLFNQENSPYLDAIIIAPQCPGGNQWVDWPWGNGNYSTTAVPESNELKAVYQLLDGLDEKMATDTSRYYVMGLSMGGFGTWDMLARHGDMFAGAIAICGGGDPSKADSLKDIPIYVVHGTNDPTVPFSGSQGMVTAIENAGGELIEFDIRQGANHFVWDYVGDSTQIATWLFSQSKE